MFVLCCDDQVFAKLFVVVVQFYLSYSYIEKNDNSGVLVYYHSLDVVFY